MVRVEGKDTKETNPDGGGLLGVGKHHVLCESQELKSNDYGMQVAVKLKCLASSDPLSVGLVRTEYLDAQGKGAGRLWTFAVAVGVITKEEWKRATDDGDDVEIDETLFPGRQLLIEYRDEKYTATRGENKGKEISKVGASFRMYPLNGPEAKSFVLDRNAADDAMGFQYGGGNGPQMANAGGGQQQSGGTSHQRKYGDL